MAKLFLTIILVFLLSGTIAFGQSRAMKIDCDIWPPYQGKDVGELSGFSTQIIKSIFNRLQKPIQLNSFPWKRALKRLEHGDSDALFSVGYADERKLFSHYPEEPIFESNWVMWVRKGENLNFNSWNDLDGMRIGVVNGYSYTEEFWLEIKSRATYEQVSNDETNFKKLNAGRIHYVIAELGNGFHLLHKLGLTEIIPLSEKIVKKDQLYIVFNKNSINEAFVRQFSNELKIFKTTPQYQEMKKRYFPQ